MQAVLTVKASNIAGQGISVRTRAPLDRSAEGDPAAAKDRLMYEYYIPRPANSGFGASQSEQAQTQVNSVVQDGQRVEMKVQG